MRGEPVPEVLDEISRRSAYGAVTAAPLLERIREAIDGPIVVMKGPEVAALYPQPALRPYGDLDVLVDDLEGTETQLLEAKFRPLGSIDRMLPGLHHDLPLRFEGLALAVEVHRNPGWLSWQTSPANEEIFRRAVPSATGVAGVSAMPPADHALMPGALVASWSLLLTGASGRYGAGP